MRIASRRFPSPYPFDAESNPELDGSAKRAAIRADEASGADDLWTDLATMCL